MRSNYRVMGAIVLLLAGWTVLSPTGVTADRLQNTSLHPVYDNGQQRPPDIDTLAEPGLQH